MMNRILEREEASVQQDQALPFLIEGTPISGRLVRLSGVLDDILGRHDYPEPVARQLAELLTLAAGLGQALKFQGRLILQLKGDGPLHFMVADADSEGGVRGYAACDTERLAGLIDKLGPKGLSFRELVGKGYLAFTVDQGQHMDRTQGITALDQESLAACMEHYFIQSDQVDMALQLAAARGEDGHWRAGAVLLQRLPDLGGEGARETSHAGAEAAEEGAVKVERLSANQEAWQRNRIFLASVKEAELLDLDLSAEALLYRLFNEDGVRVEPYRAIARACRCDPDRFRVVLSSLPEDDLAHVFGEDGVAESVCEFCGTTFRVQRDEL